MFLQRGLCEQKVRKERIVGFGSDRQTCPAGSGSTLRLHAPAPRSGIAFRYPRVVSSKDVDTVVKFAVTTFQRVFDTEPNRDLIDLEQLIAGLTRFLVYPKAQAAVDRELRRLEEAEAAWRQGRYLGGKYWTRLSRAKKRAEADGGDGAAAVTKELLHLRKDIRSFAKKDQRLWSPTHYPSGSRRGGENVLHVSCLVLDFDSGVEPEEAVLPWQDYFHILHTTWSHTPEHAKFRLVLPLAAPVQAEDWSTVYDWALGRADHLADSSKKGAGTTFALPALPDADRPRSAFSRPGPLLDVGLEGLIEHPAPPADGLVEPHEPNHFRIPVPGRLVVEGDPSRGAVGAVDAAGDEDLWKDPFPWS